MKIKYVNIINYNLNFKLFLLLKKLKENNMAYDKSYAGH